VEFIPSEVEGRSGRDDGILPSAIALPAGAPLMVRYFCLTLGTSAQDHPMSTLTVTAKGQVTLRKDLLEHLGVHPGEKITVDKLPDGRIEVKAARPSGRISDVFNFLKKKKGPSLSIEEINKIAARGWARRR
jgi:AbrB family looped-hinge helix DNA binding protein